jgi:hypothetical protein
MRSDLSAPITIAGHPAMEETTFCILTAFAELLPILPERSSRMITKDQALRYHEEPIPGKIRKVYRVY